MPKNLLYLIALVSLFIISIPNIAQESLTHDSLIYAHHENDSHYWMMYTPATNEMRRLPIPEGTEIITAREDGLIAYIYENDIWLVNIDQTIDTAIQITHTPEEQERWLSWTPTNNLEFRVGYYLLYRYDGETIEAVDAGHHLEREWNEAGWFAGRDNRSDSFQLYVDDGTQRTMLHLPPLLDTPIWHKFTWTEDNHLFVTVGFDEQQYGQPIGRMQVFYWNGTSVAELENPFNDGHFNVSQMSLDGQWVLYTTGQSEGYNLWFIWDGQSLNEQGAPDTSTFVLINDNERISEIDWMPDGQLVIVKQIHETNDGFLQQSVSCEGYCGHAVYLWSPETEIEITSYEWSSFYVNIHESGLMSISLSNGLVTSGFTVYDADLNPLFASGGPYSISRWSRDGYLAYCRGNELSVWNGRDSISLSSRTSASWLLSDEYGMTCSTG